MLISNIIHEDFTNYKKPAMFIGAISCSFKCCTEIGIPKTVCQNNALCGGVTFDLSTETVYQMYAENPITKSLVYGGLEPLDQFHDVIDLLRTFREHGCDDDFVIYTGYYKEEVLDMIDELKKYPNVIVKFGRYIPGWKPHYDEVLGVNLANNEQHAEKIS